MNNKSLYILVVIICLFTALFLSNYLINTEVVKYQVTVHTNDTLWDIVSTQIELHGSIKPINEVIFDTVNENKLEKGGEISVGQKITIPLEIKSEE